MGMALGGRAGFWVMWEQGQFHRQEARNRRCWAQQGRAREMCQRREQVLVLKREGPARWADPH